MTGRRSKGGPILVVASVISALLVVVAPPSGAAVSKDVTATCAGADAEGQSLLKNALKSETVQAPITVVSDIPSFVEPGATGIPVSMTWGINLSASLVDQATAVGVTSMDLQNAKVDTKVTGPVKPLTIEGRPPDQTVSLTAGQPLSSSFAPFTGTLENVGDSGVIKFEVGTITFSIGIPSLKTTINLTCEINATLASIPVKVAGSPNIAQPINATGTPGQNVTVDVLGQSVTPGTTKAGEVKPVDPSTLKIVDGPGTVSGGKLVIPSPAAGANSDTTFEVCAGEVETLAADPGKSETQEILLSFDQPNSFLRKPIGMALKFGNEATDVIWTAQWPNNVWVGDPKPADWKKVAGNYLPTHTVFPPADAIQDALEDLPGIGAGNIVVTETVRGKAPADEGLGVNRDRVRYRVEFVNALANKDVPQIETEKFYSILPQEDLAELLTNATKLLDPPPADPNAPPPPPDPYENMTADEMFDLADTLWLAGEFEKSWDVRMQAVGKKVQEPDTKTALLAFITGIWPPVPGISTPVPGANPTVAQKQALCSQGIVTVSSTGASVGGATTVPGSTDGSTGAKLSFTG